MDMLILLKCKLIYMNDILIFYIFTTWITNLPNQVFNQFSNWQTFSCPILLNFAQIKFRTPPRPLRKLELGLLGAPRFYKTPWTEDARKLPLTAKASHSRVAHPRSTSEDERARHPSRSSCSSSERGRSAKRARSPKPVPEESGRILFGQVCCCVSHYGQYTVCLQQPSLAGLGQDCGHTRGSDMLRTL